MPFKNAFLPNSHERKLFYVKFRAFYMARTIPKIIKLLRYLRKTMFFLSFHILGVATPPSFNHWSCHPSLVKPLELPSLPRSTIGVATPSSFNHWFLTEYFFEPLLYILLKLNSSIYKFRQHGYQVQR